MSDKPCPCLPPEYGHTEADHDNDCGGWTYNPPCGGCFGCMAAQMQYYAGEEQHADHS